MVTLIRRTQPGTCPMNGFDLLMTVIFARIEFINKYGKEPSVIEYHPAVKLILDQPYNKVLPEYKDVTVGDRLLQVGELVHFTPGDPTVMKKRLIGVR